MLVADAVQSCVLETCPLEFAAAAALAVHDDGDGDVDVDDEVVELEAEEAGGVASDTAN